MDVIKFPERLIEGRLLLDRVAQLVIRIFKEIMIELKEFSKYNLVMLQDAGEDSFAFLRKLSQN